MAAASEGLTLACAPAACDLCGGTRSRPLATDRIRGVVNVLAIVRCDGCGAVRVDPLPTEAAVREYYGGRSLHENDRALTPVSGEEERLAARRVRWLGRRAARGRLFDAGFGTGHFLEAAARAGWSAAGCDLSRPNLESLRSRLPSAELTLGRIEDHPVPGYDVVTLFHVLEHCRSPRSALAAAARLLRPSGLLIVEVPTVRRPRFRMRRRMLQNQLHLYHFDRRSLRALAQSCGFRVEGWSFHDHRAYAPFAPRNLYHLLRTGAENGLLRCGLEVGKNLRMRARRYAASTAT